MAMIHVVYTVQADHCVHSFYGLARSFFGVAKRRSSLDYFDKGVIGDDPIALLPG